MHLKFAWFPYIFFFIAPAVLAQIVPCPLKYKCHIKEDPVWGSENRRCHIFLNKCFLANENCERMNNHLPMLKLENQTVCQQKCPQFCPDIVAPVCAIYRGLLQTFSNQCLLDKQACEAAKPWHYLFAGDCDYIFSVEEKKII
ncbi:U-Kazal-Dg21.2-like [Zeugodacus cucurbitae]|uniref:U-Kazal-Dg21.2-like n=1 Tax=Zeugodacus cucurbitae TaxID=28588 RepID=UPI0023D94F6B|nr:U-Kazal-Dg21.2-like [Zeugodacus cucurbitae]